MEVVTAGPRVGGGRARQELAPGQSGVLARVGPDETGHIASFLTLTDAASLRCVGRRFAHECDQPTRLALGEASREFTSSGCTDSMRRLEQVRGDIWALSHYLCEPIAYPPGVVNRLPIFIGGRAFELPKNFWKLPEDQRASHVEALITLRQQRLTRLSEQQFNRAPQISAKVGALTSMRRRPNPEVDVAAVPTELESRILGNDTHLLRAHLRELLGLSEDLMSRDAKVTCVASPAGRDLLRAYCRTPCGMLSPKERRCYDHLRVLVDEVVSSDDLSLDEKKRICVRAGDDGRTTLDVAMDRACNAAVAASILLGVHESAADAGCKRALIRTLCQSLGGFEKCTLLVADALSKYAHNAPEWVADILARLKDMLAAEAGLEPAST